MGLTSPHAPAAAFLMSSRARSCECACASVGIFACVRDDESWSHDSHTSAYVSKEGRVAERTEKRGREIWKVSKLLIGVYSVIIMSNNHVLRTV